MILSNVNRRLTTAGILLKNGFEAGISNVSKSSYLMSASVLLCSVAEALTYELVRKSTISSGHVIGEKSEYKGTHKIPAGILGTSNDWYLCEKIKKNILISDEGGATLGKLIIFLKNKTIVSEREYRQLDWVRKERNKIHLQGLNTPDIGHTKAKVNKISDVIDFLIKKLKALP